MSERFIVKTAAEMRDGEPQHGWNAFGQAAEARTRRAVADYNAHPPAGRSCLCPEPPAADRSRAFFIIDTQCPQWRAFHAEAPPLELTAEDVDARKDRKAARAEYRQQLSDLERLADSAIVAAYEVWQRDDTGIARDTFVSVGAQRISIPDCRAAWSRELKRKQAEARDKERHRVICEDQHEL